ncbi:MAG: hypothetical protein IJT84_07950 [Clostridia bacterium]|nr:hypothetical protein [Clostridia bacterium]
MKCENYFCIYETNGNCILKEISLDVNGICEECIYPSISQELLEKEKKRVLSQLDFYFEKSGTK